MADKRSRTRANELSNDRSTPVEDAEVPETSSSSESLSLEGAALDQLNLSASLLGFTPQDIDAFLQRRFPAVESLPINIPVDVPVVQHFRDPSLSKSPENSTFDLKTLTKNMFTTSSKNNKERFETSDNILIHNELYTMVMTTRVVPVITPSNPYGQSADIITVIDNVVTIIKADNVHLWCDLMNRLNQSLIAAFDRTLLHHSKGFLTKDGILSYNDLRDFYFAQKN